MAAEESTTTTTPLPDSSSLGSGGSLILRLPDEVQQLVYRHVYPVTDITLLPDDDEEFVPRTLTQEFNIVGNYSVDLLLTCSKVCAVAKPVRDTSFTGRVNVSRARDLGHSGHWIHHNLTRLRLLTPRPTTDDLVFRLSHALFTGLRHVEIVNSDVNSAFPPMPRGDLFNLTLSDRLHDFRFIEDATNLVCAFFRVKFWIKSTSNSEATTDSKLIEVIVRQRYLIADTHDPDSKLTLGTVVRLGSNGGKVITKAINDGHHLKYWEADSCVTPPVPNTNNIGTNDSSNEPQATPMKTVPVHEIPARYSWIKFGKSVIRWQDLQDENT